MRHENSRYRKLLKGATALSFCLFLGACSLISRWIPLRHDGVEVYCDDDCLDYYDSLMLAEEFRIKDSCEQVLLKEFDSLSKVVPPNPVMALADSIVEYAAEYMGVPYVHGGNGPGIFDCSGFTRFVFSRFGYSLPRTVTAQFEDGWKVIDDPADLKRGDLVFFGGRKKTKQMGHVAIVVDNYPETRVFTFIHATVKLGVTISRSNETYYKTRYLTACRILPEY